MKRFLKSLISLALLLLLAILALRLMFPLPDISNRTPSNAFPADRVSSMGTAFLRAAEQHPGKTGVIVLPNGLDALNARLSLAARAEISIDAQYYIWHDDVTGRLLLSTLLKAAERGVRVRLLLDDNGVPGLDSTLAAINERPNFEIRLFNPSTVRRPKMMGYTFDFFRMNRRMHNKSFIVDGTAAIIGGRNIGDPYFLAGGELTFLDMDVLGVGAVVPETQQSFDQYWNSVSVFEVESIIKGSGDFDGFLSRIAEAEAAPVNEDIRTARDAIATARAEGEKAFEWTDVQLIVDDPIKGTGTAEEDQLMISQLRIILGDVDAQLNLITAYFVPAYTATALFSELAQSGRKVRIATNSLQSTDVLMVHAGYTKHRRELLEAGVKLFELKSSATTTSGQSELGRIGLSGASLHGKTFTIDDSRVFIGSFNFDPRSAFLNCEMGFLINSPTMAAEAWRYFDGLETLSYRPELTPENRMVWHETRPDGQIVTYQEEPGATWFQQVAIVIIGLLPVEWLL